MTLPSYTRNFSLSKPNFEDSPWHDDVNGNMDKLDSIIAASIGIADLRGSWENDTLYEIGDRAVDADNSVWQVLVQHTSPETGSFEQARAANPTYWSKVSSGYIDFKGEWAPSTEYSVGDFVQASSEYVAAMCIVDHTSAATTIRDDASNWIYLYDIKAPVLSTIANATAAVSAAADAQVAKIEWKGNWVTATTYELHDAVRNGGSSYICIVAHTSGTFATDLAATKWELLAQKGLDGLGAGDMAAAVYDPLGVGANVFSMNNMVEGAATKILTATERTKLAGIASGAQVNPTNAAIKASYEANADTNAYTNAEKSKLATVNVNADQTSVSTIGPALVGATALPAIADGDLFGVYDLSATEFRSWSWAAIVAALGSALSGLFAAVSHVHAFSQITSKPTTLAGYGITDASAVGHVHDDRYYTEAEVNALVAARIAATADTVLPIGICILAGSASALSIANGATTAGSNLKPIAGTGTIGFSGAGLTGTWMNVSGAGFNGSGTWCLWKRIS